MLPVGGLGIIVLLGILLLRPERIVVVIGVGGTLWLLLLLVVVGLVGVACRCCGGWSVFLGRGLGIVVIVVVGTDPHDTSGTGMNVSAIKGGKTMRLGIGGCHDGQSMAMCHPVLLQHVVGQAKDGPIHNVIQILANATTTTVGLVAVRVPGTRWKTRVQSGGGGGPVLVVVVVVLVVAMVLVVWFRHCGSKWWW